MAQSLDQIVAELDASYNPTRQSINDRIGGLQGQQDSEVAGLQATQNQAFDQITNGARNRGLGFSGIPLAEQAQYTSSQFLPAVARVKQSFNDQRTSLTDALNNSRLQQTQQAYQIRDGQLTRDFQAEQARLDREAAARNAAAANRSIVPQIGGAQPAQQSGGVSQVQQAAYNDVKNLLSKDAGRIQQEYNAIAKSAGYGNAYDQQKLALIQQLYPASLKFGQNAQVGNINVGVARPTQTITVR